MKGLMWGARGSFPPAAAMVVMVAVGSWSLGHVSTVGIVCVFYGINLFFGHKYLCQHKIYSPCPDRVDKFILFVNIPHSFSVYSGINREDKCYTNFGSHPLVKAYNSICYCSFMNSCYSALSKMTYMIPQMRSSSTEVKLNLATLLLPRVHPPPTSGSIYTPFWINGELIKV
jgi:hypothetical protein